MSDAVAMPAHEPTDAARTFELLTSVTADAPRRVRLKMRSFDAIVDGLRPDFELLLTELVANVVRHSGLGPSATMRIRVAAKPGYVWAEVSDAGRSLGDVEIVPPAERTELMESGFGLLLLDRIATRWGVTGGTGATIWFELITPEPREETS